MNIEFVSILAGTISSMIFAGSYIPMLLKAFRTKDLRSYSYSHLLLMNIGNMIYWLYITSLPAGPIWIMHTFYTVASGMLLFMYWKLRY